MYICNTSSLLVPSNPPATTSWWFKWAPLMPFSPLQKYYTTLLQLQHISTWQFWLFFHTIIKKKSHTTAEKPVQQTIMSKVTDTQETMMALHITEWCKPGTVSDKINFGKVPAPPAPQKTEVGKLLNCSNRCNWFVRYVLVLIVLLSFHSLQWSASKPHPFKSTTLRWCKTRPPVVGCTIPEHRRSKNQW